MKKLLTLFLFHILHCYKLTFILIRMTKYLMGDWFAHIKFISAIKLILSYSNLFKFVIHNNNS